MSKVTILFKKLVPEAKAPARAHDGDAGWDVTAVEAWSEHNCDENNCIICYRTGLAFAIPKGYWIDVRPRSSVFHTGLIMSNSCGVVDSGYRSEVMAVFYCIPGYNRDEYSRGDRIAQLIVQPALTTDVEFVEVDELPPSDDGRGEGGFGSTGR